MAGMWKAVTSSFARVVGCWFYCFFSFTIQHIGDILLWTCIFLATAWVRLSECYAYGLVSYFLNRSFEGQGPYTCNFKFQWLEISADSHYFSSFSIFSLLVLNGEIKSLNNNNFDKTNLNKISSAIYCECLLNNHNR